MCLTMCMGVKHPDALHKKTTKWREIHGRKNQNQNQGL